MNIDPGAESVVIVDQENHIIGTVSRRIMRQQRLIHRAAYIFVFNSEGELFVQKRTASKDIYPGYWDLAAGGVVLAGENYEDSARRELAEELGIKGGRLRRLFDHYYEDADNRVWGRIFVCTHNGPFSLQAEEIDEGCFMPLTDIVSLQNTEPITPDGVQILHRLTQFGGDID
ncbi:NUDIX hydrolase YfcD [Desulfobulbus alkaliphilus]|uniref:NUDIX hydrolase YfcD n=1 Tax=Desulfobulbus alkaliphilus TaxID=869814 RepID=UPI001963D28A|nr:NUDIX hydrolase YfcD [Desulfobulbus alkaliphilus]MBM9535865.1 NUDIX hydrolase YfcD [Desulfobulbus alkaliphilus]